jgi:NADH dehydrogenase
MTQQIITIIGGTGFLGRYIVKRLAAAGHTIRIISRHPDAALHLKTAGHVGQIVLASGDITNPDTLTGKLDYSHAILNLTGIMFEGGRQNFDALHAHGAEKLAQMAKSLGIKRFIHVSALGVDKAAGSAYARSKVLGEKAVLAAFPDATILRPSVIFGAEDRFFNQFAAMAGLSPVMPLIGGGNTKFQPVYAGDVAKAIESCLMRPETAGKTYELGGPHVFTFRQILEYTMRKTGKHRRFMTISFNMASMMASVAQYLPYPFRFTADQVKLLEYDNVIIPGVSTFSDLGIKPTAIEMVVPEYLARFNKQTAAAAAGEKLKQWAA